MLDHAYVGVSRAMTYSGVQGFPGDSHHNQIVAGVGAAAGRHIWHNPGMGHWGLVAGLIFAGMAAAQTPVQLTKVAGGFTQPTYITGAGDGSGRLFVTEQPGRIKIARGGTVAAAPFLDITDRVHCCGEQGLLSVAFPPGYLVQAALLRLLQRHRRETLPSRVSGWALTRIRPMRGAKP